jgi:hypothetical protein
MLHPYDRRLLSESLRPPDGYTLDCAVGTTFSLDLYTLLTAPLSFTFFAMIQEEGRLIPDPMALLTTMVNYADRINIFCQAGQIAIPATHQPLYTYLEGTIIEVNTPDPAGVFHPKIWLLRFTAPDESVRYRLLCLSRNLTFDRSWDTVLVLDGSLTAQPDSTNKPLVDFIAALPGMAVHPLAEARASQIRRMQQELSQVHFALPAGFQSLTFWAAGIAETTPFPLTGAIDRLLIMSPFVAGGMLQRMTRQGTGHILISRLEELQRINPDYFAPFKSIYVLQPDADVETSPQDAEDGEGPDDNEPEQPHDALVGLHAKLYVADSGTNARVWTGSANATVAAFKHNVEFLVELVGPVRQFGVDAVLQQTEETDLIDLLTECSFSQGEPDNVDEEQEAADHLAEQGRRMLARAGLVASVSPAAETDRFAIQPEFGIGKRFLTHLEAKSKPGMDWKFPGFKAKSLFGIKNTSFGL